MAYLKNAKVYSSACSDYDYAKIKDIVFVSENSISVQKYEIWDNKMGGTYPSDHLPVWVELTVNY